MLHKKGEGDMKNFTYHVPTKVFFGTDREREVGKRLRERGAEKVLIIHGRQAERCKGLYERVVQSLAEAGIQYNDVGGAYPPATRAKANEGIALGRIENVDYILAIGSGAVINLAKAIAIGIPNDGDIWEYYTKQRTPKTILPIAVVSTNVAGGGEMSAISQLANKAKRSAKILYHPDTRPQLAMMNPMLTFTLPMDELLGGIMEILMLTMERYFTHDSTMELTDNICEVLMRVVIRNSQIIMDEPNNYEARANVMWASALAHNDLTGCGNGWGDLTVHNMQKELLGMYNVPQGIALAMSWAAWAKYVYKADVFRFYRYGRTVWNLPRDFGTQEDIAKEAITFTEDIFRAMGMLGERARQQVGDVVFDTETLTDRVMDGESQIGTFKVLTREEVKDIFDDAVSYLE